MRRLRTATIPLGGAAIARRAWFDPTLVYLRLRDDSIVPSLTDLRRWVDELAADPSVAAVRTSALFPATSDQFAAAGFVEVDRLALLSTPLNDDSVRRALLSVPSTSTRPLSRRRRAGAAAVDQAAFGRRWSNDEAGLDEIRRATPRSRQRVRVEPDRHDGTVVGMSIVGAAQQRGYLQRLAVHPDHRRRGHATALVADALTWLCSRRMADCLVNTAVTNDAALALYERFGFHRLPTDLVVRELAVTDG